MRIGALGKDYQPGECIVKQGDPGDCMYVIQKGKAEVVQNKPDGEVVLAVLNPGEFFGEMALFTRQPRSATVRAAGTVRALTVDKRTFIKRIHEDPSLAFRVLQKMSERIQELDRQVLQLTNGHAPG